MRRLLLSASVIALIAGPALAQKTTAPPTKALPPYAAPAAPQGMTEAEANKQLVDQFAKILVNDERAVLMLNSKVQSLTTDLALSRGNEATTKKELEKVRADAAAAKAAADQQARAAQGVAAQRQAESARQIADLQRELAAARAVSTTESKHERAVAGPKASVRGDRGGSGYQK